MRYWKTASCWFWIGKITKNYLEEIPVYERYHRIIVENAFVALQQRVENELGLTAEEKYARLIEQTPEFMNRVPLNLVASYLGMSPETLSRVRGDFSG